MAQSQVKWRFIKEDKLTSSNRIFYRVIGRGSKILKNIGLD